MTTTRERFRAFLPEALRPRLAEIETAAAAPDLAALAPAIAQNHGSVLYRNPGSVALALLVLESFGDGDGFSGGESWFRHMGSLGAEPLAPWIGAYGLALIRPGSKAKPGEVLRELAQRFDVRLALPLVALVDEVPARVATQIWEWLMKIGHRAWSDPALQSAAMRSVARTLADGSDAARHAARKVVELIGPPAVPALEAALASAQRPGPKRNLESAIQYAKNAYVPPRPGVESAPTHKVVESLEAALAALVAGDDAAALTALVEAWRGTRAPVLAELVDRAGALVDAKAPAIAADTVTDTNERWLSAARSPETRRLGRLLSSPWPAQPTEGATRVSWLAQWPDDPRVAVALVALLEQMPYRTAASFDAYRIAARAINRIRDPRVLTRLQAAAAKHEAFAAGCEYVPGALDDFRGATLADTFAGGVPELAVEAAAVAARIDAHLAGERARSPVDALYAAVFADPSDDDARRVLADALTAAGDLRGELILLQCERAAGRATEATDERERELLKAHAADWLSGLPLEAPFRFERGFAVGGTLHGAAVAATAANPAWRLVEDITFEVSMPNEELLAFLDHTAVHLRSLAGLYDTAVFALGDRSEQSPLVRLAWFSDKPRMPSPLGLPALREVEVRFSALMETAPTIFTSSELWPQLTHVTVVVDPRPSHLGEWLAALAAPPSALESVCIRPQRSEGAPHPGWELRIRRDDGGRFAAVSATYHAMRRGSGDSLVWALDSLLPDALTELTIEPSRSFTRKKYRGSIDEIDRAAARFDGIRYTRPDK